MPADVDPPIVEKATSPDNLVAFLEVESDTKDIKEVSHLASTVIKDRMQSIPGIQSVAIVGEHKYAMRLRFDPVKLAAYSLTPEDVRIALVKENIDLPSGRIEGTSNEVSVRTLGRLTTQEEFNDLIIKQTGNAVIRLKDVGFAELGEINERNAIINETGIAMTGIIVERQSRRKRKMMITTSPNAINKVSSTSLIDSRTGFVKSKPTISLYSEETSFFSCSSLL